MDSFIKNAARAWTLSIVCLLPCYNVAHAVAYNYPGDFPPQTTPFTMNAATTDTLIVNSGTMQTPSGDNTQSTVDFSSALNATGSIGITVFAGATLTYDGTNTLGKTINGTLNTNQVLGTAITNNGTISSGTGLFAVFVQNTQNNFGTLLIENYGSIVGGIMTNNLSSAIINIRGGGNASIQGGVNMAGGTTRRFAVLDNTNFTTEGTYDGMELQITSGTLTQNHTFSDIELIQINATSTYNINATLSGDANDITNAGTMNISAAINKTGGIVTNGAGNTRVLQSVSSTITTYDNNATHTAVIQDLNNIGHLTLSAATTVDFTTFTAEYTGGYLTSGTYTLFTATLGIDTNPGTINAPSNTQFLTFGTPEVGANNITMQVTRTPFSSFTDNTFTTNIGIMTEGLGTNSPTDGTLKLLNGIEACGNRGCVENSLNQLAPLSTAPVYAYHVENVTIRQTEMRLAALRNNVYSAGDTSDYDQFILGELMRENYMWIRPYAAYANQDPADDLFGYYATTGGLAIGFDRALDVHYNLGVSLAYSTSNVKEKLMPLSTTQVKSYQGILYGTYKFTESRYMDWFASITANNYTGNRVIHINAFIAEAAHKSSSQHFTTKGIWGTNFAAFEFMQVNPEASLMYTFSKQYTYQETNAGAANLIVNRQDSNLLQMGFGTKLSTPISAIPSVIIPEVNAFYYYNLVEGKQKTVFNFVDGADQTIGRFTPSRSLLRYGAALTIGIFDRAQVKFAIDGEAGNHYSGYYLYLNFKMLL